MNSLCIVFIVVVSLGSSMELGLLLFAQHERILTGVSPQRALTAGSVQPTTRVVIARCNLKEVFGKDLA